MSREQSLPPFALKVIRKLRRIEECFSDGQDADIGRHWFDVLDRLGLIMRVQRSPARWEISQQGEDLLETPASLPLEGIATIELSEDVREALQELINGATQGEDDEYDFADEVGTLLDPIYSRESVSRLQAELEEAVRLGKYAAACGMEAETRWNAERDKLQARVVELELALKKGNEQVSMLITGATSVKASFDTIPETRTPGWEDRCYDMLDAAIQGQPYQDKPYQGIPGTSFQRLNQLANEGE
ncbi:hypothetical protein [Pseudomonas sp. NPDC090208]|uniref:hypothetical protein n=1 Tax=Pseudomonas sp. NPDC090208 TaxID=3364478 RepID=UPI003800E32B